MAQPFTTDRFLLFVGGFAGKGPFFGWLVVWLQLIGTAVWARDFPLGSDASPVAVAGGLATVLIVSLLVAYLFGGVAAAVTGVICHPVSRISMPVWVWVVVCTVVGTVVTVLGLALLAHSTTPDPTLAIQAAPPGAAGGAACGWLARQRRLSI